MSRFKHPLHEATDQAELCGSDETSLDVAGGTPLMENVVPCFTPGTVIATPMGERRVEDLKVGDRIVTRDNGLQEIRWIGKCKLGKAELARAPQLKPVLIRTGALSHGLPEADIMVSPWHNVLIQSDETAAFFDEREVLAAAAHLTGLEGVEVADVTSVTYIHFMFDQHQVVLSNGFWSESFRPDDDVLEGLGAKQRSEIFNLFPDLRDPSGRKRYQPARRALTEKEARLLLK